MPTIDDHLRNQERLGRAFLATLEPVPDDTELVRVTPYRGAACLCDAALKLRKKDLEVEETPLKTTCCGKLMLVFRVQLAPTAQIPAAGLVQYLTQPPSGGRRDECREQCEAGHEACMAKANSDWDVIQCHVAASSCRDSCGQRGGARAGRRGDSASCDGLWEVLFMLQERLREASPGEKAALVRRIDMVLEQLESC